MSQLRVTRTRVSLHASSSPSPPSSCGRAYKCARRLVDRRGVRLSTSRRNGGARIEVAGKLRPYWSFYPRHRSCNHFSRRIDADPRDLDPYPGPKGSRPQCFNFQTKYRTFPDVLKCVRRSRVLGIPAYCGTSGMKVEHEEGSNDDGCIDFSVAERLLSLSLPVHSLRVHRIYVD